MIRFADVSEAFSPRLGSALWALVVSLPAPTVRAQQSQKADAEYLRTAYDTYRSMLQSSPYRGIPWQSLGPTNISGRATDIAVAERNGARRIYAAYATSGVWKTDDNGATWQADLRESGVDEHRRHRRRAVEPRHRLGRHRRGEHVPRLDGRRRHLQVHRRRPGRSRTSGLTDTQTIARIVVHPTNPDIVYVAASGHEWTDNEMRGVFKTTDGGRTWTKVFYRSPRTGAIDLVDGSRRSQHALRGDVAARPPEVERSARRARLHRKAASGRRPTAARRGREANDGLPAAQFRGRIGIDVSRSNPNVLYAFVDNYEPGRPPREGERDAIRPADLRGAASRPPRSIAPTTRARRGARSAAERTTS